MLLNRKKKKKKKKPLPVNLKGEGVAKVWVRSSIARKCQGGYKGHRHQAESACHYFILFFVQSESNRCHAPQSKRRQQKPRKVASPNQPRSLQTADRQRRRMGFLNGL